jgi:hypothetical protein
LVIGGALLGYGRRQLGQQKTPAGAARVPFTNSRPFSALFNVGRKPVGSNHHGVAETKMAIGASVKRPIAAM